MSTQSKLFKLAALTLAIVMAGCYVWKKSEPAANQTGTTDPVTGLGPISGPGASFTSPGSLQTGYTGKSGPIFLPSPTTQPAPTTAPQMMPSSKSSSIFTPPRSMKQ